MNPLTVGEALQWGAEELAALNSARRDSDLLLRASTGWDRAFVLTHEDAPLNPQAELRFRANIDRRALGEPVQYIIGEQEFWGLALRVTPAVLIPRPETEHLIEAVLEFTSRDAELQIADVGTGSGAIAIALATELPRARILATDISEDALHIARENAARHRVAERIEFLCCDLLPADAGEHFDVIASNPPYISERDRETLAREVKDFEPAQALFAGATGYEVYEQLIPAARRALRPGGMLFVELGAGQAESVVEMLSSWSRIHITRDLAGLERVVSAKKP